MPHKLCIAVWEPLLNLRWRSKIRMYWLLECFRSLCFFLRANVTWLDWSLSSAVSSITIGHLEGGDLKEGLARELWSQTANPFVLLSPRHVLYTTEGNATAARKQLEPGSATASIYRLLRGRWVGWDFVAWMSESSASLPCWSSIWPEMSCCQPVEKRALCGVLVEEDGELHEFGLRVFRAWPRPLISQCFGANHSEELRASGLVITTEKSQRHSLFFAYL